MVKCDKCDKSITNKCPGLKCNTCGKLVHASLLCAGIPANQLAAIKSAANIDWICGDCRRSAPRRKSYIIPEDEDDDESDDDSKSTNCELETNKQIQELTKDLMNTFQLEIANLSVTLKRFSDKIDNYGKLMHTLDDKIKELEKKNIHLINKNNNLENRVVCLEDQINEMAQKQLNNKLEIVGISYQESENLEVISKSLAKKFKVSDTKIKSVKRLPGNKDKDGPLQLEMEDPQVVQNWVRASKVQTVLAHTIASYLPADSARGSEKVVIRRVLTKTNKALLWSANQKLRPTYKYIWFQNGKVLVRREESDKIVAITNERDLLKITI